MTFSQSAIPTSKPAVWQFYVYHERRPEGLRACGSVIYADSAEEVQELARRSGLVARQFPTSQVAIKRDGALPFETSIRISEAEDSPALRQMVLGIRDLYGIDLSQNVLLPNEARPLFWVRKLREFTTSQVAEAPYLMVYAKFMIGTHTDRTAEELASGTIAVHNDSKQGTDVRFGCVAPFWPIGVDQWLKEKLEGYDLPGLRLNPIVVRRRSGPPRKPLWNLTGSVTLPRTLTRYVNEYGFEKVPYDDWSAKWGEAHFFDEGYQPPVLKYSKKQIDSLGSFDVAITAEKVGNGPKIAFQRLIVSQRFRGMLADLKIKGVGYVPVVLE